MKTAVVVRAAGVWACLASVSPARAQNLDEPRVGLPPLQYNFAPPGARSLAMGASFIGLADDATASESNPAGLTILTKPEVSAHFRYSSFDNEAPNTVTGVGFQTFNERLGSPAFFSVVYPWNRAAVSLYYQRAADFKNRSFFEGVLEGGSPNYDQADTRFRLENIGLSAAVELGSKVSVGGTLRLSRVKLDSVQRATLPDFGFLTRIQGAVDDTQDEVTFNLGVLFHPAPKVSVGAVYKKGGDFPFQQTDSISEVSDVENEVFRDTRDSQVIIPDTYGAGIALRPTDRWVIAADVVRILYSDSDPGPDNLNLYQVAGEGGREALEDATEFHLGTEYAWSAGNDWVLSLRGGFYTDPDHDGLAGLDSDQVHVTLGGGVVVANRLQMDAAVSLADRVKEALISFVVRF
jgi:long-subunit fatty acid transport protein